MRYCKGRLKIGYSTHQTKMISQNKDYILVIKKNFLPLKNKILTAYPEGYREMI